ncbi:hypothetical protein QE152_g15389 [Popillia japonica]|uniref:Uncharacterized protein n=1 Tax=Popillia japonica TaxID=7064 RepID=A0AAW1L9A5_POPJA
MFKKQSKTSVAQQDQVVQYVMMCNKPTVLKQSKVLRNKQQNPRDSSCSASFISVPMQDSTDEEVFSEDVPNQNLWCIFCDGDFSADSQGEVWVMYALIRDGLTVSSRLYARTRFIRYNYRTKGWKRISGANRKLAKIQDRRVEAEICQMKRSSIRRLMAKGRGFHCARSPPYPGTPQLSPCLSERLMAKGRGFHCARSPPYPGTPQLSPCLSESRLQKDINNTKTTRLAKTTFPDPSTTRKRQDSLKQLSLARTFREGTLNFTIKYTSSRS